MRVSRLPASLPAASEAACQFAEAAGAAARRRRTPTRLRTPFNARLPVAGWPRAGAGPPAPAGATGEDLEFSGLVAAPLPPA